MKNHPEKSPGSSIQRRWDGLGTLERVKLIFNHADSFLQEHLVTRDEIDRLMATSESEWEYVIDRQEHPLFKNIGVKNDYHVQPLRKQLKAALSAAFL